MSPHVQHAFDMNGSRSRRAFTLVELLAAMTLLGVLLLAVANLLQTLAKTESRLRERVRSHAAVRTLADRFRADVRAARAAALDADARTLRLLDALELDETAPDSAPRPPRLVEYRLRPQAVARLETDPANPDAPPRINLYPLPENLRPAFSLRTDADSPLQRAALEIAPESPARPPLLVESRVGFLRADIPPAAGDPQP